MNEDNNTSTGAQIVRYLIIGLSGGLIAKGYLTEVDITTLASALAAIGTVAYGIYKRRKAGLSDQSTPSGE